jgi:tRNA threonylcarbamoyladenosine biosynthesis protein TsaE
MKKIITTSAEETQKEGEKLAREILENGPQKAAAVLALEGNLGGGKTTFLQGFAKGLEIKEKILSPTFVILKRFKIKNSNFENFYHIDCYRLGNGKPARNASHSDASGDILELDFKKIISDPKNIVAIEWPEIIKKALPKDMIEIEFKFMDENQREIMVDF